MVLNHPVMMKQVIYRGCPGIASGHMKYREYDPQDPDCIECQSDELSDFNVDPECFINIWQDLFCIVTMDGTFRKVSKAWESVLGYNEEEMQGRTYMELIHPDDLESGMRHMREMSAGNRIINFMNRFKCADGSYKWLEWRATPTEDRSLIFAVAREISQYKQIEKEIELKTWALNERLKEMNCLYTVTSLLQDVQSSINSVIPAMLKPIQVAYQYPDITAVRITIDGKQFATENFIISAWMQSAPVFRSDREAGCIEVAYLVDKPRYDEGPFLKEERALINSIARLAGQFLERAESYKQTAFLASVMESSMDAIGTFRFDGTILSWNKGAENLYGLKAADMVGKNIGILYPDGRKKDLEYFVSELRQGRPVNGFETQRIRADGKMLDVYVVMTPLKNENGEYDSYLTVLHDITERKQQERLLRESEESFRLLAENVTDVIWTIDLSGRFLYVSPSIKKLRGYTPEEVMQQSIAETLTPESAEIAGKAFAESLTLISSGQKPPDANYILEQPCKDGSTVWTEVSISSIFNEQGEFLFFLGVTRDISERKKAEDQLVIKEAAIQSSISAIALTSLEGVIEYVNNSFVRMWGYQDENEIIGRDFSIFSATPEKTKVLIDQVASGKSMEREGLGRRKNGSTMFLQIVASPVTSREGKLTHIMASFIDISEKKKAEETRDHERQLLKTMIENFPSSIWVFDREFRKTVVNQVHLQRVAATLGRENIGEADLIGKTNFEIYPAGLAQKYLDEDRAVVEQGISVIDHEVTTKGPDGKLIWESISKIPLRDTEGNIIGMLGIANEITQRKQTELREKLTSDRISAQYRMSLMEEKTEPEIIGCAVDEAMALTKSRAGFFHLLDESGENLALSGIASEPGNYRSMPGTDYYPVSEAGVWAGCISTKKPFICNEFSGEDPKTKLPPDQAAITRFISVPVVEKDRTVLVIGVGNKNEDYDEIEASQLSEFMEEVWKVIKKARLIEQLRIEKQKAEESNKVKSSLLLNMSHELRTPLNGILGFAGLLKDKVNDDTAKEMVNYIDLSGKRLMVTLTSILELSQLESDRKLIHRSDVRITELTHNVISKFRQQLEVKNLRLEKQIEDDLILNTDQNMLSNIFYYLIDNAIKFTEAGQVWVILEKTVRNGRNQVLFRVKDTGIGIAPEQIKFIFDPFRQGSEGIGRSHEGNGLGLTLCKRFLDMLGGEIQVESQPELGSIFSLYFDLGEQMQFLEPVIPLQSEPGTEVPGKPLKRAGKPLVLVVEDNEMNIELISIFLESRFIVERAYNGKMAVKLCKINRYDLILMDINLGSAFDGVEATLEIRQTARNAKTPVVAVTGYTTDQEKEAILSHGLDDYLAKPFTREELNTVINRVLTEV